MPTNQKSFLASLSLLLAGRVIILRLQFKSGCSCTPFHATFVSLSLYILSSFAIFMCMYYTSGKVK
jgi:hypothetical protein